MITVGVVSGVAVGNLFGVAYIFHLFINFAAALFTSAGRIVNAFHMRFEIAT